MSSAIILQANYRGHRSYKWYRRTLFQRLYFFYSKIGGLAHKYLVLLAVRKLRGQVIKVQSHTRGFLQRKAFTYIKRGFVLLQRQIRHYLRMASLENVFYATLYSVTEGIKEGLIRRLKAAYLITHNIAALQYNYAIRLFVAKCAVYFDHITSLQSVLAIVIQRQVRSFLTRLRIRRREAYTRRTNASALTLQRCWRRHKAHKIYFLLKVTLRRVTGFWRRLLVSRCRLILGVPCKIIQRVYWRHRVRVGEHRAAIQIQRSYRNSICRRVSVAVAARLQMEAATKLRRAILCLLFKLRLIHQRRRRYMAGFRIKVLYNDQIIIC